MIRFSAAQVCLVAFIACVAVALPTAALWLAGRERRAALLPGSPRSGFSRGLVVLTASLVFFFLYWVIVTAVDAAQASRFLRRSELPAWQVLSPMLPDLVFVGLFGWVILRLALARTPRVPAETAALAWVLGPVAAVGSALLYGAAVNWWAVGAAGLYAIAVSVYLARSERVALTYGTPRGKRIAAGEEK